MEINDARRPSSGYGKPRNRNGCQSHLFRQRGFNGIGLKDLMPDAELTLGAFYKQLKSKEDLAVQTSWRAMQITTHRWSKAAAARPGYPLGAVFDFDPSMDHQAEMMNSFRNVALGADAARQNSEVRRSLNVGLRDHLRMSEGFIERANDNT
ncbi:TetR/AcrR family transcriptional regulator [Sulfitobacter sp. EhC04]|uniref:TetR/AcrR family transcriptional regulator n=1 Tax=Sulfitobacter sp. EhC04 TaxID=1849168 RepID=UPI0010FDD2BD|nr:hypothetical protein [Sulfitobacter sp. EhC04]